MSMGSWSVLLNVSAKFFERSTYCWSGLQVQQALARSVVVVLVGASLAILLSPSAAVAKPPGIQLGGIGGGHREDFYDWEYAKKVWSEMGTWEAEEKEWAKYSADFDPWFVIYKKSQAEAKAALQNYPPEKRKNIERAHDIQMTWDTWRTKYYTPWMNNYRGLTQAATTWHPLLDELKPFAQRLADTNRHFRSVEPSPCIPTKFVHQCGPVPDWRSPRMLAEERKLDERLAELRKGRR